MRGLKFTSAAIALLGVSALGAPAFGQSTGETSDVGADARTRARLAVGAVATGALDPAGDKDWFRMQLDAGATYRVFLDADGEGEAALSDPLVRILNAQGEEIARDDDGGDGLNAYLEFTAPARGAYFVEAGGFSEEAEGRYRLRLVAGDIPGDATTDVSLSAEGDARESRLSPSGDRDWYGLELDAGETVRLSLINAPQGGVGDPLMVVYDSNGAEVARDDDSGGDLNAYLEFSASEAGRFFVEARGFSDEAEGAYVLELAAGEIGADPSSADMIDPSGQRQSQISPAGDSDWFSIEVIEGRPYRFFMDAAGEGESAVDPILTLFDADGRELAQDDDGGRGLGARLAFTPTESTTLFIAASAFGGGAGPYTLRVADFETPGAAATDEYLDALDDARDGRVDMAGDKDWYAVELAEGTRLTASVSARGEDGLGAPAVAIMTDDGIVIASNASTGRSRAARVSYDVQKDGVYYVQASSANASTGDYTVTVQTAER